MEVDQAAYVSALLGVYERNDVSLVRDLYLWAYNRSSQQYTAIQQAMGEPNTLRLHYREKIREVVRSIILERVEGKLIVEKINNALEANDVPVSDRNELFNLIETEMISLHEGNVARFGIRPSEFQTWRSLQQ